ncbi:hypothetical protein HWI79_3620, partial [Cryptosporidium felis]
MVEARGPVAVAHSRELQKHSPGAPDPLALVRVIHLRQPPVPEDPGEPDARDQDEDGRDDRDAAEQGLHGEDVGHRDLDSPLDVAVVRQSPLDADQRLGLPGAVVADQEVVPSLHDVLQGGHSEVALGHRDLLGARGADVPAWALGLAPAGPPGREGVRGGRGRGRGRGQGQDVGPARLGGQVVVVAAEDLPPVLVPVLPAHHEAAGAQAPRAQVRAGPPALQAGEGPKSVHALQPVLLRGGGAPELGGEALHPDPGAVDEPPLLPALRTLGTGRGRGRGRGPGLSPQPQPRGERRGPETPPVAAQPRGGLPPAVVAGQGVRRPARGGGVLGGVGARNREASAVGRGPAAEAGRGSRDGVPARVPEVGVVRRAGLRRQVPVQVGEADGAHPGEGGGRGVGGPEGGHRLRDDVDDPNAALLRLGRAAPQLPAELEGPAPLQVGPGGQSLGVPGVKGLRT